MDTKKNRDDSSGWPALILQITPSYKPAYIYGGTTLSVSNLSEVLTNKLFRTGAFQHCEVEVLTTTANGKKELNVKKGKTCIQTVVVRYCKRITKDHTHFSPVLLWNLYRILKTKKRVVVHIHSWWNLTSVLACLLARSMKTDVVLSPRGMLSEYTFNNNNTFAKRWIHYTFGRRLLRQVHLHATSEKEKEDILTIIKPKAICVIPNLFQFRFHYTDKPRRGNLDQSEAEPQTSKFSILFISRIQEKKGLEILFQALENITIDWELTIGGSGEKKYVDALVKWSEDLKIASRIKWAGFITDDRKYKLMESKDLLILPSYNENFGNVVVESLAVGTPVLISDKVGLAAYVEKNDLGWVRAPDPQAIADALIIAYHDQEKRDRIRNTSAMLLRKDFDEDQLIHSYIELYRKIAQHGV